MNNNDEISTLVKTAIQSRIVQAFHDTPEAIDKLVQAAISHEVDEHGCKPSYHTKNKMPYLEYMVGDIIRGVARQAVIEAVKERQPEINAAVKKSLSADDLVQALTKTILGATQREYTLKVSFADEETKSY